MVSAMPARIPAVILFCLVTSVTAALRSHRTHLELDSARQRAQRLAVAAVAAEELVATVPGQRDGDVLAREPRQMMYRDGRRVCER